MARPLDCSIFFFNDTATTEIYTLSLHDALPIWIGQARAARDGRARGVAGGGPGAPRDDRAALCPGGPSQAEDRRGRDRKSTRLNSSHANISYAVFCLKKKNDN